MNTNRKRRNLAENEPLTPAIPDTCEVSFAARQQLELAKLTARLGGIEYRFNAQQKRIEAQETFIATLIAEGKAARTRLRFLENAVTLSTGPAL